MAAFAFLPLAMTSAFAQKAQTEKAIVGCWQLADLNLNPAPPQMDDIKKQVLKSEVCFEKDGKFTSKNFAGAEPTRFRPTEIR